MLKKLLFISTTKMANRAAPSCGISSFTAIVLCYSSIDVKIQWKISWSRVNNVIIFRVNLIPRKNCISTVLHFYKGAE